MLIERWLTGGSRGRMGILEAPPLGGRTTALAALSDGFEGTVLASRAIQADRDRPLATVQRLIAAWVEAARGTAELRATRDLVALRSLAPELGPSAEEADETRLQGELTLLVQRLARTRPVLIAVDDLHLADPVSRGLLQAVAAATGDGSVHVVGTWCPSDATEPTPRAEVFAVPAPGRVDPEALRVRCAERLHCLDRDARWVLGLLAVADTAVDADALWTASGASDADYDRILERLERAGWLVQRERGPLVEVGPVAPGWWTQVAEVLSVRERRRLHAAWLQVALDPDRELLHTLGAGTRADPEAVQRLHRAGLVAAEEQRLEPARELLEAACALADRRSGPTAELLEDLGNVTRHLNQVESAIAIWTRALRCDPEPRVRARLRRALAMAEWDAGRVESALGHVRAGWTELEGHSGPEFEAILRTELLFLDRRMRMGDVRECVERLAAVAVTPEGRSELWQARAALRGYHGDFEGAIEAAQRGIDEARTATEVRVRMRAAHSRNMALIASGHPREALDRARNGEPSGAYAASSQALALMLLGDRAGLDAMMEDVVASGNAWTGFRPLLDAAIAVLSDRPMDGDEAIGNMGDFGSVDRRTRAFVVHFTAAVELARGDCAKVVRIVDEANLIREDGIAGPLGTELARIQGEALARTRGFDRAQQLASRMDTLGPYGAEAAAFVRAHVARERGRSTADRQFEDCAASFEARDMAPLVGRARLAAAELQLASDPARAQRNLDAAWSHLLRTGADAQLARARELYSALGRRAPATPRKASTEGPLSERELEVVRLVARGMTNKQVAKALFLSPSTIATHLKRVYKRLDVHSRAALTRWAADHGHLAGVGPV